MFLKPAVNSLIVMGIVSTCIACGGSSKDETGTLNVNITDAPVDDATEVVVRFNAVELKPQEGPSFLIEFDEPQSIDLLALQNGETAPLLQNETLDAGVYNWMRLQVDADQGEIDSYISFEDGSTYSLYVPSGDTRGLQLNRQFTIPAGASANFTIDFDLRKSIINPSNDIDEYKLKPTLRIVDNTEVGEINGFIDASLVSDPSCEQGLAVYAYSGADATIDDEGSVSAPIASSIPVFDNDNNRYDYTVSFLLAGDYTIAVTCDAENDDPETDEDEATWSALTSSNTTVEANQSASLNFE